MLFAMAALAGARIPGLGADRERAVRKEKAGRRRVRYARHSNLYAQQSGIGARECARRRGGLDWLDYRIADRIRRGLGPLV